VPLNDTTVLLVEDDDIYRTLLRETLEVAGARVLEAEDGRSALERLAESRTVGAVVLDIGLPDIDGIDLLRRMKGTPSISDIPVVLATSEDRIERFDEGVRAGAYFYLTKPFERSLLLAVLKAAIDAAQERQATREALSHGRRAVQLLEHGRFSLSNLDEARALARVLGGLCPEPEAGILALQELLINGVEHGNLEIDYPTKTQLVLDGTWHDEVALRLADPRLGQRRVTVDYRRDADEVAMTITDEGAGFDWEPYLTLDPARMFDPHGRGIAMAAANGTIRLQYQGAGNVVAVSWSPGAMPTP
jgi:CheY-like chemotaxis protein/anti-sigma regulatory factor (Ser/Thr protein kinase)